MLEVNEKGTAVSLVKASCFVDSSTHRGLLPERLCCAVTTSRYTTFDFCTRRNMSLQALKKTTKCCSFFW